MTWKNQKKWHEMWSGSNCLMCNDINQVENEFSHLIKEFNSSIWRLPKRQQPKGYTMLAAKTHASEIYLMEPDERKHFFDEVALAARLISKNFRPVKIHYGIFGSLCPHVHCHLIPKYTFDDPHGPIKFGETDIEIPSNEAKKIIQELSANI